MAGVSEALAGYNATLLGQVAQYVAFAVVFVALVGVARVGVVTISRR